MKRNQKRNRKFAVILILVVALLIPTSITCFASQISSQEVVIQAEGQISQKRIQNITSYYLSVPENVRQRLENDGWQFICSSESFGKRYGYNYSILALTAYQEKKIYISNRTKAESAIIHEIGHVIDDILCDVSASKDFNDIFTAEHDNVKSFWKTHHSNTDTACEYFAEAFQIFIQEPEQLQKYCPRTYEYITNTTANLTSM